MVGIWLVCYLPITHPQPLASSFVLMFFPPNLLPFLPQASTVLSVGGIRQQFGIEENIKMSLFGAEFLRDIHRNLSVYGKHPVQVNFNPQVLFTCTLAC